MRVRRNYLTLSVLLVSLLLVGSASASSVTMTYQGHQGVSAQDGSPYIGYPYCVSINGSSTFTPLICDSFDNNESPSDLEGLGPAFSAGYRGQYVRPCYDARLQSCGIDLQKHAGWTDKQEVGPRGHLGIVFDQCVDQFLLHFQELWCH
jgi:hypothetical protein